MMYVQLPRSKVKVKNFGFELTILCPVVKIVSAPYLDNRYDFKVYTCHTF